MYAYFIFSIILFEEGNEHRLQHDRSYRIKEVSENTGPIVMDFCITIDPITNDEHITNEQGGKFYRLLKNAMKDRGLEIDPREPQVYSVSFLEINC